MFSSEVLEKWLCIILLNIILDSEQLSILDVWPNGKALVNTILQFAVFLMLTYSRTTNRMLPWSADFPLSDTNSSLEEIPGCK